MFTLEKSKKDIRRTVLTNVVKMLTERKLLNVDKLDKNIKDMTESEPDDMVYKIKLDNVTEDISDTFVVKILPSKITAVNKASGIPDFLQKYKKNMKFIVVNSISPKAYHLIKDTYSNSEVFTEEYFMCNLVDYVAVPKHTLLTKEEVNTFYTDYNCKKRNLPKILTGDPVAKYFNMQPGDIVKVTRPSETSGVVNSYRLVVKGDINDK